ncbi:MAG: hypothetical protein FD189_280 [Elusimicrobia bacterium]|nr:MAG: hypothetical protein FD189_280 [Elusimicrobiota bacterium]
MSRAKDIYERIKSTGYNAVKEFVDARESENLFLDFKRSSDRGAGKKLHDNDRNNLSRAISGFSNSEGGVIVWGIDCRSNSDGADVACAEFPIADVKKFVGFIEGSVSGCTIPPCSGIENCPIETEAGAGFVATFIPKSNTPPHQVVGELKYYMRAGSNFVPVPHAVLAGMFGRHPAPNVFIMYHIQVPPERLPNGTIKIQLGFLITNGGPGIAEDLFLNLTVSSACGELSFSQPDLTVWSVSFGFGRVLNIISKQGLRLAPDAKVEPVCMNIILKPPFTKPIKIAGMCGCSNSMPFRFKFENSHDNVAKIYNELIANPNNKTFADNFTNLILNIPMETEDAQ